MGTITRALVVAVAAVAAVATLTAGAIVPAAAQTTPLLDASDLPAGYHLGEGSPLQRTTVAASVPTIGHCVWGTPTRVAGTPPVIWSSGFVRDAGRAANETVWQFDTPKAKRAAKAFYAQLTKTYRAATKCNPLREPDPAPGSTGPVDAGRFTRLTLGRVGDAAFGVTFVPTAGAPTSRVAIFRTADAVGTLTVSDPDVDPTEFAALARTAADRAT